MLRQAGTKRPIIVLIRILLIGGIRTDFNERII